MYYRGERGFTLVELLVVVSVIAVLAAIAIPQFTKYRLRAYLTELDSDAKNAYTAAQSYLVQNPTGEVDNLIKLVDGGYRRSPDVYFTNGNMTLGSGKIEIYSDVMRSFGKDNNALIFLNGRIEFANSSWR